MRSEFRRTLVLVAFCGLFSFCGQFALAHHRTPFPAPTVVHDTVRGHVHVRNGIFRNVYRERWGSGIQPGGAMVLTNLFNNAALVAGTYLTGSPPSGGSGQPSKEGDFSSESAEVPDLTHKLRMDTLEQMDLRANDVLKALKIPLPAETLPPGDVSSGGTFHSESAPLHK